MSKLSISDHLGSKSSQKTLKSKESLLSKKSKISPSFPSVHGSKFGRSITKYAKKNDPGLVQTLSTVNSRVIRTVFNLAIQSDSKLPDLTQHEGTSCIRKLGKSLNVIDYEFNYSSFWLLDTLSKTIKDLQLKNVSVTNQNTFIAWFSFVLRCISVGGTSREETFSFLQDVFKRAVKMINEGKSIPKPEEIESDESTKSHKLSSDSNRLLSLKSLTGSESLNRKKRKSSPSSRKSSKKPSITSSKSRRTLSKTSSKTSAHMLMTPEEKVNTNLEAFYTFIKMIYQVFGDRFVYSAVSEVYSSPMIVTPVDVHLDFHEPKPYKPEPVSPPPQKEMSPKKRKASKSGKKEGGTKKKDDKKPRSSSKVSGPDGGSAEGDKGKQKKSKGKKEMKDEEVKLTKDKKDKGEQKSKTKKVKDEAKNQSEGKKTGKGKKFSRKSRKSSSLYEQDKEKLLMEARIKQFDRIISPEMEVGAEKLITKDKYILPLADAVSGNFVENLIRRLLPPEEKPVEEPKPKGKDKDRKRSNVKEGKKQKDRKKT